MLKRYLSALCFIFSLLVLGASSACAAHPVYTMVDWPVKIDIQNTYPSAVALVDEEGSYSLNLVNSSQDAQAGTLKLIGQVPGEEVTVEESWDYDLAPGKTASFTWVPDTSEPTYLALKAEAWAGEEQVGETVSALLVVPEPSVEQLPAEESFFATMILRDPEAATRIGVRADRLSAGWHTIERQPGVYNWSLLDRGVKNRLDAGIGVVITVRPTGGRGETPPGAEWISPEELSSEEHIEKFAAFTRAVVERYKDDILAIEIMNEPNLMCNFNTTGEVSTSEIYARLLEAGYAASKEVAPDLPVVGLSVAGGDIPKFGFSQAVIDMAGPSLDINGGHPYTSLRYVGGDSRPLSPIKMDAIGKIKALADLMSRNGIEPRVWATEFGWALIIDEPMSSPSSRLYGAYTAQGLTVARSVPELEKLFWFSYSSPIIERNSMYGMFRKADEKVSTGTGVGNWFPAPSAAAYATASQWLNDVMIEDQFQLGAMVYVFQFNDLASDDAVFCLWVDEPHSTGGSAKVVLPTSSPKPTAMADAFGRSVEYTGTFYLEPLPVFVRMPESDVDAFVKALKNAKVQASEAFVVDAPTISTYGHITVDAINNDIDPIACKIFQEGESDTARSILLDPGLHQITLEAETKLDQSVKTTIIALDERTAEEKKVELNYYLHALPRLDLDKGNWQQALRMAKKPVVLDQRDQVLPADPGVDWRGPEDLSAKVWTGWSEAGVLLILEVTDDMRTAPPELSETLWLYDGIQIAFDMSNRAAYGYNEHCYEFMIGLSDNGPVVRSLAGALPTDDTIHVTHEGTLTTYEVLIPWEWLDTGPLPPGDVFRMNFIVNEVDAKGRECWIGLTPGIGEGKVPGAFHQWALEPLPQPSSKNLNNSDS